MKVKHSPGDLAFLAVVYLLVIVMVAVAVYPFLYVFSMSVSDPAAAAAGRVRLLPVGFSTAAYERVFANRDIWRSFYNSCWYTVVGTFCMVLMTVLGAYPLSRPHFFARRFFNGMIIFSMFFFGGMIPFFQVVKSVGLYGSRWALVIPYLISTWNLIVMRTSFQSIPEELYESAKIDGCNEFRILAGITLPLSKQILAIMALFYGVSNWNGWFAAVLFIPNADLHPLQVYLKRVLVESNSADAMMSYAMQGKDAMLSLMQVKYAIIIVASLPIILVYPFVQKYFEKGVMIGSLKG